MRRRWLRGVLMVFVLFSVLAAGLTWYLNTIFLPGPARRWIATQLAEQTGRRIQLGALRFQLWEGISIDDIVIFEDRRDGDQPFLALERVTLHGPLPTLQLTRLRLRLVRDAAGVWNAESLRLFHRAAAAPARRRPIGLARLLITDGELLVEDQGRTPGLDATLTRINLRAMVNLPHTIALKGTAQWQTVPVTALLLQGVWNLGTASGEGSVTARQFPLETVRPYLPAATAAALRDLAGAATVTVKGVVDDRHREITATATTAETRVQWTPGAGAAPWQITGEYTVTGQGIAQQRGEGWSWDPPTATVQCHRLALTPPAPYPAVERLEGTLRVTPTALEVTSAAAVVNGLPVRVHGTVTAERPDRWPQARLAIEADADGPLETLWQAAAPLVGRTGWLAELQAAGGSRLHVAATGTLQAPNAAATLTVHDARLTSPTLGRLESLNGQVVIEPNLLTAAGVRGTWRALPVQLDGTLVNFAAPEISGTLTVGEVVADAALAVAGPQVTITELTTTYRKSRAKTTGTVTLGGAMTSTLQTEFSLDAADGLALLPASWTALRAWQPTGRLKGEAALEGPLRDPRQWQAQLSVHAGECSVRGIRLENLLVEYRQHNGAATLQPLTALVYGGTLSATATLRWDDPHRPFAAKVVLANLELGRLARELSWKDQQVSGLVSGECQVGGTADALPASLDGQGRLQVTNGRLFEMPLLKGLADVLGASALRRVVFREAAGTCELHGDRVTTQDLTVYGDLATLTAAGTMTFAGALDARVVASIDPTAFEHSPQFAHTLAQFLHQAGYLIGEIKIGGTLAQPTYEVVPVSLNRILKEQVFKRLGGLLGGLLQ